MACTIVSTAGAANQNSYISIADGDTFFETHLYADDWNDAGTDEKCKALQMATRLLDQYYEWIGVVSTSSQALLWPRAGVVGPDGYLEDSTAVPTRIQQATAELARLLLAEDRTAESEEAVKNISQVTAGSVSVSFRGGTPTSRPIPDSVAAIIGIYGTKRGAGGSGAVVMRRA